MGEGYPLAVGDRWDYFNTIRSRIVVPGSPVVLVELGHPWAAEIIGTEVFGGRLYHMQAEYDPLAVSLPPPPQYLFALRQDRSGLYNRDLVQLAAPSHGRPAREGARGADALRAKLASVLAGHPHRAAFQRAAESLAARLEGLRAAAFGGSLAPGDGPDPAEISLLRYPLRPFARWIVRDSPRFSRIVEARETLELPAGSFSAWRIRGDSELFGPGDVVHFWYARQGLVRMLVHTESDAVDEQGNVVGRLLWDLDQRLTAYSLERRDGSVQPSATLGEPDVER
jgi:hypothetical protein